MFVGHKKFFPAIWLCFHGLILCAFIVSLFISPKISFGTSLFEILPPSSSLHEVQNADNALASKTGRAVTILARADSFEKAKLAAEKLYSNYVDDEGRANPDFFDSLSLYVDSSSVAEITKWLHENRFSLIDEKGRELLENGRATEIADEALASVYGAFSISDLANLAEDPFLLSERNLHKLLEGGAASSTNMSLRDEVLFCEKDGEFYVLIRGTVSQKGSALASKKNAVKNIYDAVKKIGDADFIFSGVPFHSYESSSSAQAQISVISTVALVLIVVVFLYIFRSIVPALVSALAVVFSCGIGFVSVLLFFRGIHVLTFVFGTTLIGTCLDYSIHYFVNWKANPDCDSGIGVRNHILRGISLGFTSTEICFAALFFAPFPLLKQVSVFLFTGLATAYLSVVALYPILKIPKKRELPILIRSSRLEALVPEVERSRFGGAVTRLRAIPGLLGQTRIFKSIPYFLRQSSLFRVLPILLVIFSLVGIFANYRSLKIQNNIQELYSMSKKMLQNEISSAKVLNTGASGWYFIVKADSEEELLQKNEELSGILDSAVEDKKLGSYLSVVQFIPSEKVQKESYAAAGNLVSLAKKQYEALGFGEANSGDYASQYEKNYRSLENRFVHPSDENLPATIQDAIANLWIGEVDGAFYSCVMPLHALPEEEKFFREYAGSHEGIFFVNKVKDISAQLDILSRSMLKMLALAFVIVIAILCFCYRPPVVLKIAFVPLLVTLVTTAVLLLCRIHLSFFPITALVLVFGLGLDYIIYAVEAGENSKKDKSENLTSFAIFLSFLTTALSFGALAISTFPPVHFLGLTVFVGLLTAVVGAFCVTKRTNVEF